MQSKHRYENMKNRLKIFREKIRETIRGEGRHIGLFLGVLLVGALTFEAGFVQGVRRTPAPIVVEKPVAVESAGAYASPDTIQKPDQKSDASIVSAEKPATSDNSLSSSCHFVGSKNSTLYHLPTCAPAKRIKPENRVCFSSEDDARARGYKPGCLK